MGHRKEKQHPAKVLPEICIGSSVEEGKSYFSWLRDKRYIVHWTFKGKCQSNKGNRKTGGLKYKVSIEVYTQKDTITQHEKDDIFSIGCTGLGSVKQLQLAKKGNLYDEQYSESRVAGTF
jgi:hypothetical protein